MSSASVDQPSTSSTSLSGANVAGHTVVNGSLNPPAVKRSREAGVTGITTAALMEMVAEQNERLDRLAGELEKEREARAALERKVLALKEKLIVANVIH